MNTFWDRVAHFYDDALRGLRWTDRQPSIAEGVTGRVLEACCGTGSLALALRGRGVDMYALDLAPRMLARAATRFAGAGRSPARLVQGDVTRLPFSDRAFDYVLVAGSLGLLPRPQLAAALHELARVGRRELRLLEPLEEREGFYFVLLRPHTAPVQYLPTRPVHGCGGGPLPGGIVSPSGTVRRSSQETHVTTSLQR